MAELSELDTVRLQRDEWRLRAEKAERQLAEARELLRYADEAVMAEYQLRVRPAVNGSGSPA